MFATLLHGGPPNPFIEQHLLTKAPFAAVTKHPRQSQQTLRQERQSASTSIVTSSPNTSELSEDTLRAWRKTLAYQVAKKQSPPQSWIVQYGRLQERKAMKQRHVQAEEIWNDLASSCES